MIDLIRVVIVDDHTLFREVVTHVLETEEDILVLGQGSSAGDAVKLTQELHPDILLLDINMPGGGLNSASAVSASFPQTKIVMLTGLSEEDLISKAVKAGACAYVLKGVSGRELVRVIRGVQAGQCFIDPILPRGV